MEDVEIIRLLGMELKRDFIKIIGSTEYNYTYSQNEKQQVSAIHINHFGLKKIPDLIFSLKNLIILDLNYNYLTMIPEKILELNKLDELWLCNNDIQEIPEFVLKNSKLKIYARDNPLIKPPQVIVNIGMMAIKKYYNELKINPEIKIINEAKLIILGEGSVGKTCLKDRLIYNRFNEQNRTQGINIDSLKIRNPQNDDDIKLNLWDFGGQEIYHSTHQFFLTKRSMYILVWNARKSKDYEHIYKWLNIIDAYSEQSPILIVMTKKDEMDDDLNMNYIKNKYPQVKEMLKVNNKTCEGISELIKALQEYTWEIPVMRTPWIESWFSVRREIEKKIENWIFYDEFKKLCIANGVIENNISLIDEYLHDIGVIIHYKDDINLKSIVILKPQWATNAVYKILDYNPVRNANGILKADWLTEIWDSELYPSATHSILMNIMNRFELSYELKGKNSYLVAELLPNKYLQIFWNPVEEIKLSYRYDFLPTGILTRFIVLIHDYIIKDKNDMPICSREGVYISYKKSKALVLLNIADKKIDISVDGENQRDFLSIISYQFDLINSKINSISFKKEVPCSCSQDCIKNWDYENLLKLERKGINDIRCDESGLVLNINKLLDGYAASENRHGLITDGVIKSRVHLTVQNNIFQSNNQNVNLNITIDVYTALPQLQTELYRLSELIAKTKPNIDIEKMIEIIDNLSPGMNENKFISPMNKLRRLLDDAFDETSKTGKIIKKSTKIMKVVQNIAKLYNQFAQWLMLPQVPVVFLGK